MTGRRPRIAHIIHWDGPGGGPLSVIRQMKWLSEEFEQAVLTDGEARIRQCCLDQGIEYVAVPLRKKRLVPAGLFAVLRALHRLSPDIVLAHGQWAGPVGTLAARIARVPRVVYVARWPAFYASDTMWRGVRNFTAEALPVRLADKVIVLSEGSRYQYMLRNMADADKLVTIPNRVDPAMLPSLEDAAALRIAEGWSAGNLHVVSAGRLADQKRIDWLLESWGAVQSRVKRARLWIIGQGPARLSLERLAGQLGVSSTVTFLGPRDNAIAFIMAADVVAMTSLYEGHANVPMEALACGRPIVASDVDGVRESVVDGETGFLVPPGDTAGFADRLITLLEDGGVRQRMASSAALRAATAGSCDGRDLLLNLLRGMAGAAGFQDGAVGVPACR